MQVLVLAVQNSVPYAVLGTATSGVTLLRGIGGSVGTAIFGSIFTNRLLDVRAELPAPVQELLAGGGRLTGEQVAALPDAARTAYQQGYVDALTPVFLVAAGVALVGFAISWLLQERPLRATAATSQGLDDSLAAPRGPDSLAELERALTRVTTRERARALPAAGGRRAPASTAARVRRGRWSGSTSTASRARGRWPRSSAVPQERIAEVVAELRDPTGSWRARLARWRSRRRAARSPTSSWRRAATCWTRRSRTERRTAGRRWTTLLRRLARELVGERP